MCMLLIESHDYIDPQIAHEIFVSNGAIGSGRPFGSYIYQVYAMGGKYVSLKVRIKYT